MDELLGFFADLIVIACAICPNALFVTFIAFIVWMSVYHDGWRKLARVYRTEQSATGKEWMFQSGAVGWRHFRHNLILTANAEGLFLEIMWPFAHGRPRLLIPWRDFHNATLDTYLFWRNVKVNVGDPRIVTLRLPPAVFEQSEGRKLIADQLSTAARTNQS